MMFLIYSNNRIEPQFIICAHPSGHSGSDSSICGSDGDGGDDGSHNVGRNSGDSADGPRGMLVGWLQW